LSTGTPWILWITYFGAHCCVKPLYSLLLGPPSCLALLLKRPKMDAVCSSETSVQFCRTMQRQMPAYKSSSSRSHRPYNHKCNNMCTSVYQYLSSNPCIVQLTETQWPRTVICIRSQKQPPPPTVLCVIATRTISEYLMCLIQKQSVL
jgi:hypothetical protein